MILNLPYCPLHKSCAALGQRFSCSGSLVEQSRSNQKVCVRPPRRGSTPSRNSLSRNFSPRLFSSSELIPYRYGKFIDDAMKTSCQPSALKSPTLGPQGQKFSAPTRSEISSNLPLPRFA